MEVVVVPVAVVPAVVVVVEVVACDLLAMLKKHQQSHYHGRCRHRLSRLVSVVSFVAMFMFTNKM